MSNAPKTITQEEVIRILDEVTDPEIKLLFMLMVDAGLRVGEAVQLEKSDLILDGKSVKAVFIKADITKTHSERIIPLSNRIQVMIGYCQDMLWSKDSQYSSMFAFSTQKQAGHISVRHVERILKALSTSVIAHPITPHVLRHTFATRMMRITSSRIVQQLLGHKRLTSTQIYTHPNGEDLVNAIGKLND